MLDKLKGGTALALAAAMMTAPSVSVAEGMYDGVTVNILTRPGPVIAGRIVERGEEFKGQAFTQSPQIQIETAFETSFAIVRRDGSERLGRAIRVTIEDNGPGVPAEKKARMFDMFMSSKSGGRGLGLSVVNEIVSAHNGRIKVDSKPGLTRFSIYLPLPRSKTS